MSTAPAESIGRISPWRNSPEHYGRMARLLHWGTAILFLVAYVAVYFRHWFTDKDTPENWLALQTHLTAGITVMVFVVLRVYWRLTQPQPQDLPAPRWQHLGAHAMHWVLYVVMIVMPITGYLGTGVAVEYFGLVDIPSFKDTALFRALGIPWETFEKPIDFVHKKSGAWLVWGLIVLHAGAAIYHHAVLRDSVLTRMLRGPRD